MISDEMRELLSAYVDGELNEADRARAEVLLAGDAGLRREVSAYRRVGQSLRAWDKTEHGGEPSPAMAERVLARIRLSRSEGGSGGSGARRPLRGLWAGGGPNPLLALLTHPLALAAGLLAAVGLGLYFSAAPAAKPVTAREVVARAESEPYPPLRMQALPEKGAVASEAPRPRGAFDVAEAIRRESGLCKRAETLRAEWEDEEERQRERQRYAAAETRTGSTNPQALALLANCEFAASGVEALLCVRGMGGALVPATGALTPGRKIGLDSAAGPESVLLTGEGPSLALLGEVLVDEGDAGRRTRVLSASNWIARKEFTPVTWADEVALPANGKLAMLQVQPWMLGPNARRRVLEAGDGRDPAFLLWLRAVCKGKSLCDHLAEKAASREKVVLRLVDALKADATATGFAVFAGNTLQGVEILATHELMMQFAPRLLHGYLLEAGSKALRLEAPAAGAADLVSRAKTLIEELPDATASFDDGNDHRGSREGWPEGLRRVLLKDGVGNILGAGLLSGNLPVHLTLFPD